MQVEQSDGDIFGGRDGRAGRLRARVRGCDARRQRYDSRDSRYRGKTLGDFAKRTGVGDRPDRSPARSTETGHAVRPRDAGSESAGQRYRRRGLPALLLAGRVDVRLQPESIQPGRELHRRSLQRQFYVVRRRALRSRARRSAARAAGYALWQEHHGGRHQFHHAQAGVRHGGRHQGGPRRLQPPRGRGRVSDRGRAGAHRGAIRLHLHQGGRLHSERPAGASGSGRRGSVRGATVAAVQGDRRPRFHPAPVEEHAGPPELRDHRWAHPSAVAGQPGRRRLHRVFPYAQRHLHRRAAQQLPNRAGLHAAAAPGQ